MQVLANGEPHELENALTLAELLLRLGYRQQHIAVAVNRTFVPRQAHDTHPIREGDEVEIVAPMQGG